jgi:hypothetical protein
MTVHSLRSHAVKLAEASARRRVVALFERHRATPGAPYDERHFMDFLLKERMGRRTVADGLHATRRLNAFINDIQYEFAICFAASERHANHSLQDFVERVVDLGRLRHQMRWRWKDQLTAGLEWAATVLANIVLLIAAVTWRDHAFALAVVGGGAVLVNAWFGACGLRALDYCRRLHSRIAASEKRRSRPAPYQWPSPYLPVACLSRLRRRSCASSRTARPRPAARATETGERLSQ